MSNQDDTQSDNAPSALERVEQLLEQWRADIDELLVQLDLASKDVRDDLCHRLETVRDVETVARSRLDDVRHDLVGALESQRDSVVTIVRDIRLTYESAREAAERHRRAAH